MLLAYEYVHATLVIRAHVSYETIEALSLAEAIFGCFLLDTAPTSPSAVPPPVPAAAPGAADDDAAGMGPTVTNI